MLFTPNNNDKTTDAQTQGGDKEIDAKGNKDGDEDTDAGEFFAKTIDALQTARIHSLETQLEALQLTHNILTEKSALMVTVHENKLAEKDMQLGAAQGNHDKEMEEQSVEIHRLQEQYSKDVELYQNLYKRE